MTKDPIHILNSVMEDSREYKKELWILFQDMKRAYDSVSCGPGGMLHRSMLRLKIHPGFIRLCLAIAEKKENRIITAYGLTEAYHPKCGLDQGGVECPLFWRMVYDVLLSTVMDSQLGYCMAAKSALEEHHKISMTLPQVTDINVTVAALAFVDDTTWVAPNGDNLQKIVNIAKEFFEINKIEINPKKTEMIIIHSNKENPHVKLGNDIVSALPPGTAARMLGVWFSADGRNQYTKNLVLSEVSNICSILARKAVTDKQAIYIVNNVLIPRILYRLATVILPPKMIAKITSQYTGTIRSKIGLVKGTPNSILNHRRLYGVRSFEDVQGEEQISTALLRLNDHGIVGEVMRARLVGHQFEAKLPINTMQVPSIGELFQKKNMIGGICRIMRERQIEFQDTVTLHSDKRLIATMMPPLDYKRVALQCARTTLFSSPI